MSDKLNYPEEGLYLKDKELVYLRRLEDGAFMEESLLSPDYETRIQRNDFEKYAYLLYKPLSNEQLEWIKIKLEKLHEELSDKLDYILNPDEEFLNDELSGSSPYNLDDKD